MDIPPISANPGLACDVLHLCWWGRASMVGRLLSPTTLTTFSDSVTFGDSVKPVTALAIIAKPTSELYV